MHASAGQPHSKDALLKKYCVQSVDFLDQRFPDSDLKSLLQDFFELFSTESHEPENFKKNLVSDVDHAVIPANQHVFAGSPKYKPKFFEEKKTLYSPFESTGLTKNRLDEKVWFFLDEDAVIRGPFSTVDMDRWFNHGELHGSTKVAYDQKEKFCKIYKFVEIFKEFEKKHDERKGNSLAQAKETPTFRKFGFVNQNKGKSAGNSPLLNAGRKGEDSIDEDFNLEENVREEKKIAGFSLFFLNFVGLPRVFERVLIFCKFLEVLSQ